MTGAMLPPGAQRVVQFEIAEERDGRVRLTAPETGRNVIERGENIRAGEVVLEPRRLAPQDLGVLAASGAARVQVAVPPRVARAVHRLGAARARASRSSRVQIYDSNGPQLAAQAGRLGCPARYLGIAADEPGPLAAAVRSALPGCDLLLLSGGVSKGEFDYVPGVLRGLGAEVLFHGLALKPGKPTLFARFPAADGEAGAAAAAPKYIFGLPGNPVTVFVVFELLVRPLLLRLMGLEDRPTVLRLRLAAAVRRRARGAGRVPAGAPGGGEIHPLDLSRLGAPQRAERGQRADPPGAGGPRPGGRGGDRCATALTGRSITCASR